MCRAGLFRQNKHIKVTGIALKCTALSKIKWITKKCTQVGCQTTSRTIPQTVVWGYAFDTFADRDQQFPQCNRTVKQHPKQTNKQTNKKAMETKTICPAPSDIFEATLSVEQRPWQMYFRIKKTLSLLISITTVAL